jgi:hypothetical protein
MYVCLYLLMIRERRKSQGFFIKGAAKKTLGRALHGGSQPVAFGLPRYVWLATGV